MPEMTRTIQRHASHQEEGTNTYVTYLRVLHTWDTATTCTDPKHTPTHECNSHTNPYTHLILFSHHVKQRSTSSCYLWGQKLISDMK